MPKRPHRQSTAAAKQPKQLPAAAHGARAWALSLGTALAVVIAVCAVYGRTIDAPFIFDDNDSILQNASIQQLWPLVGDTEKPGPLNTIKDSPMGGRPLVNLSLAINHRFGGTAPRGYHLLNMGVHVLSALLLAAIVRGTLHLPRFGVGGDTAWLLATLVALIWAVHPLQTESVAYVTQRTELFVGFFYLATLYCSLRYWMAGSRGGRMAWLSLATLACLCGAASKEVIVSAPLVVLLFERTFLTGSFRDALRRSWPLYLGLLLSWVLLLALNYHRPRGESAGFHHELAPHVWWFTQAKIVWLYLKLAVWPWPLVIHYGTPYVETVGEALPWLLATGLLIALTVWLVWRTSAIGFLAAAAWLVLAPTLVVPILTEVAAERRMYLPLASLVVMLVVGGYRSMQRARSADSQPPIAAHRLNAFFATVGLVIVLVLALVGGHRLTAYESELGLWQDALVQQPDDPMVRIGLGNAYLKTQQLPQAIEQFQAAIQLAPNYGDAYNNLAGALLQAGKSQEALAVFELAVQTKPKLAKAHFNYATALLNADRLQESIERFQTALELKPSDEAAQFALGTALLRAERLPEAIDALQRAVRMAPEHADAHNHLGLALDRSGQVQRAMAEYAEALRLNSELAEAHYNLANALLHSKQPQQAAEHFQQAIRYARSADKTALADAAAAKLRALSESWASPSTPR